MNWILVDLILLLGEEVLIDVQLSNHHLAFQLLGKFLDRRFHTNTWSTPWCPHVDQYNLAAAQDSVLKRPVGELNWLYAR